MPEVKRHKPGTFCWTDLTTSDLEGARVFYSELFNWGLRESESSDHTYTMMQAGGVDVVGMGQPPELHGPPAWLCMISVADVDAAAAKVREAGGAVHEGPFAVDDAGRMAVCADPSGATFGLWEAGIHQGAGRVNEPSTPCWYELASRDTAASAAFFKEVLGWEAQSGPMGGAVYTTFMRGPAPVAGMLAMTEEWGDAPSHWMVYFQVASCEETAQRAASLGGEVCVPPTEIAGVGRFAVITDPQGAVFSIMQMHR
jgi:predicted enzyme related to lactoylglutathione lyase